MVLELLIIERLDDTIIRITYRNHSEVYFHVSLRNAEADFRECYALKGVKLEKVII